MVFEITPQPTEQERAAVEAALALGTGEEGRTSAWADALLPARDDELEA